MGPPPEKSEDIVRVDFDFRRELARKVEGNLASYCYQCGACVGDCPATTYGSGFNPREIMLKVLYGLGAELLREDSVLWRCTNCYNCHERCPQEVKPVEVIISLKNMLADRGIYPRPVARVIETFETDGADGADDAGGRPPAGEVRSAADAAGPRGRDHGAARRDGGGGSKGDKAGGDSTGGGRADRPSRPGRNGSPSSPDVSFPRGTRRWSSPSARRFRVWGSTSSISRAPRAARTRSISNPRTRCRGSRSRREISPSPRKWGSTSSPIVRDARRRFRRPTIFSRTSALRARVNERLTRIGREYRGKSRVRHIATVVRDEVGYDRIRDTVVRPLEGLRVAIHYGCHLLEAEPDHAGR